MISDFPGPAGGKGNNPPNDKLSAPMKNRGPPKWLGVAKKKKPMGPNHQKNTQNDGARRKFWAPGDAWDACAASFAKTKPSQAKVSVLKMQVGPRLVGSQRASKEESN